MSGKTRLLSGHLPMTTSMHADILLAAAEAARELAGEEKRFKCE